MKKLFLLAFLVVPFGGCKKFLEERSQYEIIPKTTKQFSEILYTEGMPGAKTLLQPYLTFMDDDFQAFNGEMLPSDEDLTVNAPCYQWQPDFIDLSKNGGGTLASSGMDSWSTYYQLLLGANVAIQEIDGSQGELKDKIQFKGEAFAARAFYHFMLVNLYALPYNDSTTTPDKLVGIPMRLNANLEDESPKRSSVKAVYDQVIADLDSSIQLLEQQKLQLPAFRMSYLGAELLASRVNLYMENWEKVIEHASVVIERHPQLMDFTEWQPIPDPNDPNPRPFIAPDNPEVLWYYGSVLEYTSRGLMVAYDVSYDYMSILEPGDLRRDKYISEVPEIFKPLVLTPYSQLKNVGTMGNSMLGNAWRTAEAYLNRAEAYIQLYRTTGNAEAAQKGLDDLNKLRASRWDKTKFVPWTLHPGDELLQLCRQERRRELFMEGGHRWFDLRRYGMPAIRHSYMPTKNTTEIYELKKRDPQYVMPISNEVLEKNRTLGQTPSIGARRMPI
ncbi:RagB/SusD family nutrient uptake outer membrane protein [Chitinophaga sp. sic0106]|uniref:RagB/SusD family nutrient uptake outer membrane protein n=1 Tax=Chitinophaga sp. sic0106 TaxID=2854785 RepID=UPI001C48CFB8|nr:RagB/SusD family nutrient uptake outer membrane protein [Chitinophaga sp. sic0106]MBV7531027.1 RagB/SusD family nutrient uptake outer membrane protein [Chitinophaga sp. sic0106]